MCPCACVCFQTGPTHTPWNCVSPPRLIYKTSQSTRRARWWPTFDPGEGDGLVDRCSRDVWKKEEMSETNVEGDEIGDFFRGAKTLSHKQSSPNVQSQLSKLTVRNTLMTDWNKRKERMEDMRSKNQTERQKERQAGTHSFESTVRTFIAHFINGPTRLGIYRVLCWVVCIYNMLVTLGPFSPLETPNGWYPNIWFKLWWAGCQLLSTLILLKGRFVSFLLDTVWSSIGATNIILP